MSVKMRRKGAKNKTPIKQDKKTITKKRNSEGGGQPTKLQQLKLTHAISPLENPSQLKLMRKDIARMKTELRQRELNK